MKKINIILCMLACAFSLTACGNEVEYDDAIVDTNVSFMLDIVANNSTEEAIASIQDLDDFDWNDITKQWKENGILVSGDVVFDAIVSFSEAALEMGGIISAGDFTVTSASNGIQISLPIDAEMRDASFILYMNEDNEITGCQTDLVYSFGEKMIGAGFNTLLGMGTVFAVLILISILISLFKYIPMLEERSKMRKAGKNAVDATLAQIAIKEEGELSDDSEIVAAIAAAIAIYNGANGVDDFVVRSIRKKSTNKWKNA